MRILAAPIALTVLLACRPAPVEEPDDHAHDDHAHDEGAPEVSLAGLRGIRTMKAPEPREEGAWFPGEAIGDPSAQFVLTAPVGGIVRSLDVIPGRPVRAGAHLASWDSPEGAELLSRWLVAGAAAESAAANLAREDELFRKQATSKRELEEARRLDASARAELDAARLALDSRGLDPSDRSGRFTLRAPRDGSVLRWEVRPGESVEGGRALGEFQTSAARLVRAELPLPGPAWKLGDATEVRTSDGQHWSARVVGVPAVLDDDTRRLTYRLEIVDGTPPLPGRPVEVRVPFASGVILPQVAVQQIEGIWGVFVADGDHARFAPVRRGVELGADVMVLEGIAPGDVVVADGAYLLKSSWLKSRGGGDDHDH